MAGPFIRGALVQFVPTFLVPLPNVIVFQYNPETMTHSWEAADPTEAAQQEGGNPLAVRGPPGESFSFTLALDARDTVADGSPVTAGVAALSGVYSRLAALELLQFPVGDTAGTDLVGEVSASVGAAGVSLSASVSAEVVQPVPAGQLPTVLFVWGPGRILPVRVTELTVTEKLFDALLNPVHAEAQMTLRVLTPAELAHAEGPLAELAKVAYAYSQGLRKVLAAPNLANAAESVIGMLPV